MRWIAIRLAMIAIGLLPGWHIAKADTSVVINKVNDQISSAWTAAGLTPAPDVDDARFLRRVTLDITGRIPEPQQVIDFLADSATDKRARAVERLLDSPAYAEHWATYWDNLLIGRLTREAYLDRAGFHEWLRAQFEVSRPWNELVYELITAEGYNTNREPLRGGGPTPKDFAARYSPATSYFLRFSRSLPDFSATTSKVFLGVQIQCAQCHDHKTEKWTQQDFKQFTPCFAKSWANYVDKPAMLTQMVGTPAMATLLRELDQRERLRDTLVIWMGEFGRTPKISQVDGRDHYPNAWSTVLAGGGVRSGRAYGSTDEEGAKVGSNAVTVPNFFATIATLLGMDPRHEEISPVGRPIAISDNGEPITALIN